jgi:hypothetical protein
MSRPIRIASTPEQFEQGLFGQVFYYLFQILPYLYEHKIFPAWDIRTTHYGDPPDRLTIPGALDLAYTPSPGPYRTVNLEEMRRRHAHVIGNDWPELHRMWSSYFKIPPRVVEAAKSIMPKGRVLGIHYRGTDKQTTSWDSNPITQDQYLTLIADFLANRSGFDVVFAATDEHSFIEKLRSAVSLPVVALGKVEFHMSTEDKGSRKEKTDRAMVDCVLLSRCQCVIETSSALPSFAKVFNPDLEIYRCAASKLFGKLYTNMPYFPVAQIPVLPVHRPESIEILRQTMEMDWTFDSSMRKFQEKFSFEPRWTRNHKFFSLAEKTKVADIAARVVRGYR